MFAINAAIVHLHCQVKVTRGTEVCVCGSTGPTLLEQFWQISLYATDKALCDVMFSQIEGNGGKFCHIELINSLIF